MGATAVRKLSRLHKPPDMSLETWQRGFQPTYSEIVVQYGAKRDVRFRPGTSAPRALTSLAMRYFDAQHVLRASAYAEFESFLSQAARFNHDLRCDDDVLGLIAEVRD